MREREGTCICETSPCGEKNVHHACIPNLQLHLPLQIDLLFTCALLPRSFFFESSSNPPCVHNALCNNSYVPYQNPAPSSSQTRCQEGDEEHGDRYSSASILQATPPNRRNSKRYGAASAQKGRNISPHHSGDSQKRGVLVHAQRRLPACANRSGNSRCQRCPSPGRWRERGGAPPLTHSRHGNYVIQKIVEALPTTHADFVAKEMLSRGVEMAKHPYGCRILERLIEHHICAADWENSAAAQLIGEVVDAADELFKNRYAQYVLQSILEHAHRSTRFKSRIADVAAAQAEAYATHRNAAWVVQASLELCSPADRRGIEAALMGQPATLLHLSTHTHGVRILKQLMAMRTAYAYYIRALLNQHPAILAQPEHGQRLLQ